VIIKKIKINVYVHAFISDEPGRAKTCYCKQHNGRFGCLFCLNEGMSIGRNLRCWPGINSQLRTHELYKDHVQLSAPTTAFKGIERSDFSFGSDNLTPGCLN
jgi:hypothetical protein